MKKVLLLIAMVVATMTAAQAQQTYQPVPFPADKAYWCEKYDSVGNRNGLLDYFRIRNIFFLNGEDTVMSGIRYKKLYFSNNGDTANAYFYGGIYEDSLRRVWYKGEKPPHIEDFHVPPTSNNYSCMLYDFSLEVGDTIDHQFMINTDAEVVSLIDTIEIGGLLRKIIHFENRDFTWIEGVGSSFGLLCYNGETRTCDMCPYNMLLCNIQNDLLIYHLENFDCFSTNAITSPESTPSITAYPNPAKDRITFDFGGMLFETLQVINTAGVVVREARLGGQTQYSQPLKGLPTGVYVYRLQNGETATQGKFVVEN